MIVKDSDIESIAQTHGQELQVLKLHGCTGFSMDGLLHIGRLCNNLNTLYLKEGVIDDKHGRWLHKLTLKNDVLKTF